MWASEGIGEGVRLPVGVVGVDMGEWLLAKGVVAVVRGGEREWLLVEPVTGLHLTVKWMDGPTVTLLQFLTFTS